VCARLILARGPQDEQHSQHPGPFELSTATGPTPCAADAGRRLAGGDRRVGDEGAQRDVRKVLLTYWERGLLPAALRRSRRLRPNLPVTERHVMDRGCWPSCRGGRRRSDAALEDFDSAGAGRRLAAFIDDLSNWYIRLSRRRFWQAEPSAMATCTRPWTC